MKLRRFIFASLVACLAMGCATTKLPEGKPSMRGFGKATISDFDKLKKDDTAADVIRKMGSPVRSKEGLPFLIYFCAEEHGLFYVVGFDRKDKNLVQPGDKITKVYLTDLVNASAAKLIWPRKRQ